MLDSNELNKETSTAPHLYVAIQNNASGNLGNIPLCSLNISNPIHTNTIRSSIIISLRDVSV